METFAQRLIDAKNMLAGLTAHTSELSKRGITPEALAQIKGLTGILWIRQYKEIFFRFRRTQHFVLFFRFLSLISHKIQYFFRSLIREPG